ncbi:hypothetical protein C8J57DRAFT_1230779 [Mycena rebaudengoi]|nr:hypothetical protein C8J57DRAFT_1230779 [Mycena rebaudengoi]
MPRTNSTPACDWLFDPKDKPALADFFKTIKSEIGEGGNWDAVALQKAEVHVAGLGTPLRGGPKTAASIKTIWGQVCGAPLCGKIFDKVLVAQMKKTHESLLLMLQGQYPGASGWTYNRELGFSVRDDNIDAWKAFIKAHPIFRPFANKGWDLFDTIHNIVPTCAKGMHVHNPIHPPTSTLPAPGVPHLQGLNDSAHICPSMGVLTYCSATTP